MLKMEIFYFSRSVYQIVRKCLQNSQHEASTKTYQQLSNKKTPHYGIRKRQERSRGAVGVLPSARALCCPCQKEILEQVLTRWHIVFISCYIITGML